MSFALLLALDGEKVLVGIMQWAMGKRKKILLLLNATKNIPGVSWMSKVMNCTGTLIASILK